MKQTCASRWDSYFFRVAEAGATMSKDPSTQCGAVIVRPNRTIAATGWNGFPRGVVDRVEHYENRETKLLRIVHAEANAITSAREPLDGFELYVTPFMPCANCAGLIIQAGIETVNFKGPAEIPERWRKAFDATCAMFEEAGVELNWFGEPSKERAIANRQRQNALFRTRVRPGRFTNRSSSHSRSRRP